MFDEKTLRTAFRGFNRADVMACIEQVANKFKLQLEQLEKQLREAREENDRLKAAVSAEDVDALKAELAGYKAENEALQAECASLKQELEQHKDAPARTETEELEIYRRAERTEREAKERAARICEQTAAALADITAKVDTATAEMAGILQNWEEAAAGAKVALQEASDAVSSIRRQ